MNPIRLVSARPLTPEERALVLRVAIVIAICFGFIGAIGGAVGLFVLDKQQTQALERERRARQEAIGRERQLRVEFNRQLNRFVFQQCLNNERQDTVIVSILVTLVSTPNADVVRDAINTLEPARESDCIPPKATGP
jgi:hypothetical protein